MRTLLLLGLVLLLPAVAAQPMFNAEGTIEELPVNPCVVMEGAESLVCGLVGDDETPDEDGGARDNGKDDGGFAGQVAATFHDEVVYWGIGSAALVLASIGGFAAVTRYISPKEALKNPQRSMLYGFVRGNPGAHLKQLSDEFGMKTSSILWHIRKLESAELVRGERVGGYRVFYAVEGGIEIRRVSRALTAIQNENARRIFAHVQRHPGATTRLVSESLNLHGGTARWHLRRLREHGLLDELVQDVGSRFYNTPLGDRALETLEGTATTTAPNATAVPE